jgi:hypothetical protein
MMLRRLILAIVLWMALSAQAHTLSVSHLEIVVPPDGDDVTIELDLAIRDLALTLALDANRDEQVTWGELQAIRGPLNRWVMSNMSLSAGDRPCQLQVDDLATRRYDDGAYATIRLRAQCPSRNRLRLRYGLLFDRDPLHRALVTVRDGTSISTTIARMDARDVAIGAGHPFLDFLREGGHHILIGYDHLAFLVSLLLPAALVRANRRWLPVANFKTAWWHILGIVTAFTAAHSITLSMAALGWVTPASRWVEVAIAASVLAAALNNLYPLVTRRVWVVGFAFGLVHGFGFAGALSELGLPNGARLQALVGFNLGVEIGQLAVVGAILPLLFAIRRWPSYAKACLPPASLAIAFLAGWWLYKRLCG